MNRRSFLELTTNLTTATAAMFFAPKLAFGMDRGLLLKKARAGYETSLTPEEWRALLTENQFAILREEATERKFSSPLNDEKRVGIYHCAGCELPAYSSETKYDSKTGWPSFYDAIADAIRTKEDNTLFATRTEVHCRRCKGHFGHIFDDGPAPTGKRHCLNGLSLIFKPA